MKVKAKDLQHVMEKMNPRFMVDSKMLPEIKKWKVGKEYKVEMTVKQERMEDGEDGMRAGFEIKEIKAL